MSKKQETIEDIVNELRNEPLGEGGAKPWLHYLADRIISAHECEMSEKNAAHKQWRENYHTQLAAKDAEIARLKAALKPVTECDMSSAYSTANTIANHGTLPSVIDFDKVSNGIYCLCNAVREAQRIMKEGEAK